MPLPRNGSSTQSPHVFLDDQREEAPLLYVKFSVPGKPSWRMGGTVPLNIPYSLLDSLAPSQLQKYLDEIIARMTETIERERASLEEFRESIQRAYNSSRNGDNSFGIRAKPDRTKKVYSKTLGVYMHVLDE